MAKSRLLCTVSACVLTLFTSLNNAAPASVTYPAFFTSTSPADSDLTSTVGTSDTLNFTFTNDTAVSFFFVVVVSASQITKRKSQHSDTREVRRGIS